MSPQEPAGYWKNQVIANLVINSALNGLIAYFFYRERASLPLAEIAVDIQITLAIIAFFVSWIAIVTLRQKMSAGAVRAFSGEWRPPARTVWDLTGLHPVALRSLAIMLGMMVLLGGLLTVPLALLSPGGLAGWVYIPFKSVYTGLCAAGAAALSIGSVFWERKP
jgi:hypothetical protein